MLEVNLPEVIERYKQLYTGAICDILDKFGFRNQILPYYIQSMTGDVKIAGPAFTGCGQPTSNPEDNDMELRLQMLESITPHCISVWSTDNDLASAHWGEIMSTSVRERGCQAVVLDGGVRDMGFILKMGFPVFARFKNPAGSIGRWNIRAWQVPITIGSTQIHPGDFIFGDIDGVVVIPREIIMETLEAAEDIVNREIGMKAELKDGMSVTEAYRKYGTL